MTTCRARTCTSDAYDGEASRRRPPPHLHLASRPIPAPVVCASDAPAVPHACFPALCRSCDMSDAHCGASSHPCPFHPMSRLVPAHNALGVPRSPHARFRAQPFGCVSCCGCRVAPRGRRYVIVFFLLLSSVMQVLAVLNTPLARSVRQHSVRGLEVEVWVRRAAGSICTPGGKEGAAECTKREPHSSPVNGACFCCVTQCQRADRVIHRAIHRAIHRVVHRVIHCESQCQRADRERGIHPPARG